MSESSFSPSCYGALFQPSQDVYDPWYQQSVNFYDYGQHQQPVQPVNVWHSVEPNQQQNSCDSCDQTTSNMHQNHLPPSTSAPPSVKQSQKTLSGKMTHVLMKDRDGNFDRNSDKAFRRRPSACTRCKQVKMKCKFALGEKACQQCKPKGYHCVVEAPKSKKDAIIETLMKQLHNLYLATPHLIDEYIKSILPSDADNPNVLAWLGRLKSSVQIDSGSSKEASEPEAPGPSLHDQQCNLFAPSKVQEHKEMSTALTEVSRVPVGFRPECEAQKISLKPGFRWGNSMGLNSPEILVLGIVTLEDAKQLFDIFYKYINPFIALLDPVLLTSKSTLARCPVLFMVICAITSRYHPQKSSIYQIAMHCAKRLAANALVLDEMKSIELCQAYILMSIYAVPERSWDRDQGWLYTGLAVSIATTLYLNRTAKINSASENEEREYLNRVRVWQICFLLDQAVAIQLGKPYMMKEDTIIHHLGEWRRQSQYNLDYDVYLCGYSVLVHIVARFHKEVLGDQSGFINSERGNLWDITMRYDVEIEIFKEEWKRKFKAGGVHHGAMLRRSELHFYVAYFRLVVFSFGFRQVFHAGIEAWYDYFFTKCFEYAKSVIRCMNEDLVPGGFMQYAPDHHFMCAAFAVVFLFKADEDESVKLIGILISKFSSSDIAVDDRHTPKLYARFLATVLDKYQQSHGTSPRSSQTVLPVNIGMSRSVAREADKESADDWQKLFVAQGYDSAGFTYWPEATHAMGSWPIPFGSDAELLHIMDGHQNIDGNGGAGGQPGTIEDKMITSIQSLDNPEWLQGMLMPGFMWNSSERA
ncbi:uncharacterized protein ARMOST_19113 [Armillaria ostoyae]|uniref:Zn(2)-C6 fungal-type domain-containing protein n=1 Tax=Armillaria ostoyae TaxID=47428 RepID=A0A284S3L0_ARMOS|nr:uncharacterized protein ARMOST_19113 [Armillaria ostoyae]